MRALAVLVGASLLLSAPAANPAGAEPRPQGAGLIHADDFESGGGEARRGSGFRWSGRAFVAPSTERARSGRRSLKFRFGDLGAKAVTEQSRAQLNFTFPAVPEVWLEWYAYYPDGTEGIPGVGAYEHGTDTPDNNKVLRIYADGHYSSAPEWGASSVAVANGAGGSSRLRLDYFPGNSHDNWLPKRRQEQPSYIDLRRDRGRWVQLRFYGRKATQGRADGVLRYWKDGRLMSESTTLALYDPTRTHDHFSAGYLYGAANSGFPRATAVYVDDFKMYRSDPGWR
ncbi:MAG TPA: hypothetical protein VHG51_05355 [Longimicrobiaceae bacterium]|nr:hypothetical protein [Longimicrobiaceae bacterium]